MKNLPSAPLSPDEIKEAIYGLFDECLNMRTPFHRKIDLFIVSDVLAQRVMEATGLDIFGHWVCIDNFGIKEVRTIASTKKQKVSRLVFHTMYKMKVSK